MFDLPDTLDIFYVKYQISLQITDDRNLNIPSDKATSYYLSLALMSYHVFLIFLINITHPLSI